MVGKEMNSYYGYKVVGVYQTLEECAEDPIAVANKLVPGDFKYEDVNGDNVIDGDDRQVLGSYIPNFTYGINLGLNWKNLDFELTTYGQTGGQIYNRKYWKLPIVYGGFVGCAYALTWNNRMYKDYSQAYLDIMDDDPDTKSYEDFLPHGMSAEGMEDTFKKRKDFYRRNRDLSIFCFIGVYILSVIDAYVDAELSDFDISKDLGLQIQPVIFNDGRSRIPNTIGLQCSFKF